MKIQTCNLPITSLALYHTATSAYTGIPKRKPNIEVVLMINRGRRSTEGVVCFYARCVCSDWLQTEAELARQNPGKMVSSDNTLSVPSLPQNPSRVDRLVVESGREHARVTSCRWFVLFFSVSVQDCRTFYHFKDNL